MRRRAPDPHARPTLRDAGPDRRRHHGHQGVVSLRITDRGEAIRATAPGSEPAAKRSRLDNLIDTFPVEVAAILEGVRKGQINLSLNVRGLDRNVNRQVYAILAATLFSGSARLWAAEEEIAATYGIPVAQEYDEFMGPDGTDDPRDRGLLWDQRHPSEAGSVLIAEMLHDLGYDLAE